MQYLISYAEKKKKSFTDIGTDAEDLLMGYSWPGNVRELKNVMEWAVFMHDEKILKRKHLGILEKGHSDMPIESEAKTNSSSCINIPLSNDGLPLEKIKRIVMSRVLEMHKGNKSAAARYLNISRRALLLHLSKTERN